MKSQRWGSHGDGGGWGWYKRRDGSLVLQRYINLCLSPRSDRSALHLRLSKTFSTMNGDPRWPGPGPWAFDQLGNAMGSLDMPVPDPLWPSATTPILEHHDFLPPHLKHFQGRDPKTPDWQGPRPNWLPDSRKPYKHGEAKACFIWPRDKHSKKPLSSWQRWKDVATGKGPPVFIGSRTSFSPTKDQWSNWLEYDNFGYRVGAPDIINPMPDRQKYNFRTRRFTNDPFREDVWSGIRRGPKGEGIPTMVRDAYGGEWTSQGGMVPPWNPWSNPYRYNPWTSHWDYLSPDVHL